MTAPVPPPNFIPQLPFVPNNAPFVPNNSPFVPNNAPFVPNNAPVGFPGDNEQSRLVPPPEFLPPFKRPRHFEENPPIPMTIQNRNPRMPPPARGVSRIFFKTRPCEKFREGTCPYGSNCNFAHGIDDIRKPPPNWQEIVGGHVDDRTEKWEDDLNIINRHRLCKNFYNGKMCPYGARCNYRHEDPGKFREEAGRSRESSAISISTTGASLDNGGRSEKSDTVITLNPNPDVNRAISKPVPWKTRMCNKWWETSGNCPFGEKCHFAHGAAELKKYGGHNEAEMGNVVSTAPPKPPVNSFNDASVTNPVVGAPSKKPVQNKFLKKWSGPEKLSRIYADWIDDIEPAKVDQ